MSNRVRTDGRDEIDTFFWMGRLGLGASLLKDDQRSNRKAVQLLPSVEEGQFDEKPHGNNLRSDLPEKCRGSPGSASGRGKIVHQHDFSARFYGIDMDGDDAGSIFEVIGLLEGLVGQLALFANRHDTIAQSESRSRGKNEAASIDSDDSVDGTGRQVFDQKIDAAGEQPRIGQNRCDVFELDARLRKIGNVPNGLRQFPVTCGVFIDIIIFAQLPSSRSSSELQSDVLNLPNPLARHPNLSPTSSRVRSEPPSKPNRYRRIVALRGSWFSIISSSILLTVFSSSCS